jgi:hypothetical protein
MNDPQPPSAAPPTPSPQDVMMQMWMGLCSAHAVAAAARLGIADVLAVARSPQGLHKGQECGEEDSSKPGADSPVPSCRIAVCWVDL